LGGQRRTLYVGETGLGIKNRIMLHKHTLNEIDSKKKTLLINIDTSRIDVYASRVPAFFNFITQPEYRLHVMEDKRTRLLEESSFFSSLFECLLKRIKVKINKTNDFIRLEFGY
jgi:hypothetical protein